MVLVANRFILLKPTLGDIMTINVREYRKNFNFGNLPDEAVLEFYKLFNERMNTKDHNQIISELKIKYNTRQQPVQGFAEIASRPSLAKSNWKEILKVDYEEIEKGWPFPKKNNTQPHVTIEYTQEQQDKINAFSTARGVTAKQAGNWLTQNNWNLPQDALVEFRRLR